MDMSIFDAMGTKAVINARGTYSMLGGSVFSPRVWAAMEAAARSYVDMEDLLDASGQVMATLLSTEAALATPGVAAALALASAALVTEGDGAKLERLPDVSGMKADVLIQRRHRYRYDRTLRLSGARLVDVGDEDGTTADQLAAAFGPRTAALCVPAHLDGEPCTVSLADAIVIAHRRGVPVLVDAAYLVYPIERLLGLANPALTSSASARSTWGGRTRGESSAAGKRGSMPSPAPGLHPSSSASTASSVAPTNSTGTRSSASWWRSRSGLGWTTRLGMTGMNARCER